MSERYWDSNGAHQALADQLTKMVPAEGRVEHPRQNKALESYRKATYAYYELYNNGLCNGNTEFRAVFGIKPSVYKTAPGQFNQSMYEEVESAMDNIVILAALEQGLVDAEAEAPAGAE